MGLVIQASYRSISSHWLVPGSLCLLFGSRDQPSCILQAEVIQNYENANVRNMGQGEAGTENTSGLNLAVVRRTTVQVTRLPL
jgi:hypothetical protein